MKITGEELKLNDGGVSDITCSRCDKKLRKHITGKGRFFCKYCGRKWEERKEGFYLVNNKIKKIKNTDPHVIISTINKLIEQANKGLF